LRRPTLLFLALLPVAAVAVRAGETDWLKVTADEFTVLTPATETAARQWAVELAEFRRSLQAIVPVPAEHVHPVTVVLFPNHRAIEPFLPLENGRPARIGGLFVRTNDVNTIMLSLDAKERETRHIIFHEAVHWHLGARHATLPLWLGEGLAELYGTFHVSDDGHHEFGAALPGHVALLDSGRFLPLAQLVATDRHSVLYNESRRGNVFYAEAWALTHLLLLGDQAPGAAGIQRYIDSLQAGVAPEAAFTAALGATYGEMEKRLRRYVRTAQYRPMVQPHADAAVACTVSAAVPAEIELAQGALLTGSRGPNAAEPFLRRAAELAPHDVRAWEQLAVARAQQGAVTSNPALLDAAAEDFRRAIQLGGRVPAYEGLAGLIYSMATFRSDDVALLERGLGLSPGNPGIEAGIAAAEIRRGEVAVGRRHLEQIIAADATDRSAYARRMLEREHFKAELAEVNTCTLDHRFRDALAVLDRLLARELSAADRQIVTALRRTLSDLAKGK
jgi:hypothetical protein